jgi:biotin carboxylase
MQRYVVIVDPLSTGREYGPAFRAAGVEPVAVLATPEVPEVFAATWHPENFGTVLRFDGGNLAELAGTLAELRPLCVIAGAETGVELADRLAPLVCPQVANVPALAAARRDKWAMAQAVAAAGIPHLRQTCSDDPAAVAQWLREEGLEGARLVLKPPKSAGTDDVHLVPPGGDWKAVFDQIIGRVNKTGIRNDAVLVEEFAEGAELLVDGYSVGGRHGLVDACRYTKGSRGDRIGIYDRVDFLPADHPDVLAAWPYVRRVLDAVGIRNGCSHTEVMLTPAGPRLLEVAARPAGGGHQLISDLATGDNHIKRTVRHWVHGGFAGSYRLERYVCGKFISAPNAGTFRNEEVFDGIDDLPTFWAKNFPFHNGDRVAATEDIYTYLAWVILSSTDPGAIEADYRWVREREALVRIDPAG